MAAAGAGAGAGADARGPGLDHTAGTPATLDVAKLLESHKADILLLKSKVTDVLSVEDDGTWYKYDDLCMLRFLLSFKTVDAAAEALRKCIAARATPEHQVVSKMAMEHADFALSDKGKEFSKFMCFARLHDGLVHGGPLMMIRPGMSNTQGLFDFMSHAEAVLGFLAVREFAYKVCDEETRKTGRLTKMVIIFDMSGMSLSQMDKRMQVAQKEVGGRAGFLYPQLQDKIAMVNTPSWMGFMMMLAKKVLPRHMTERMEPFSSTADLWNSEWGKATLNRAMVPSFVGGTCPLEALPPSITGDLIDKRPDEGTELVIAARDSAEVRILVPVAGSIVRYRISLEAHGISLGAKLLHGGELDDADKLTGEETVLRKPDLKDKVKADNGAEKGEWRVPAPGIVVVTFDNSYSLLRSKTLHYHFHAEAPASAASGSGAAAGAVHRFAATDVAPTPVVGVPVLPGVAGVKLDAATTPDAPPAPAPAPAAAAEVSAASAASSASAPELPSPS